LEEGEEEQTEWVFITTMISIEGLTKKLGNFQLGPLDLQVCEGQVLVVLGENGSGKSTLLNLVSGILKPDKGRIFLKQDLLNDLPIEKRRVGYVFQKLYLFPHLNVCANINFGLRRRLPKGAADISKTKVREVISMLHIESLLSRDIQSLSAGEQQKVALARTLVTEPHLLLMDEPLTNLDIVSKINLLQELRKILSRVKIPVIYVTHYPNEAFGLADRVLILNGGNIVEEGVRDEVMLRPKAEFTKMLIGTLRF
jgi:ABC-type Fe3+/spermidine/putrescine transport system ATPase subunit